MLEPQERVTLIVAQTVTPSESPDRGGGETHSFPGFITNTVSRAVEVDPELLRANIIKSLDQMKQIFAKLKGPTVPGWKVQGISVGLTISAEGSVGVATAGVEASIEIEFAPE
jgi:hypothetical protein